MIKIFHTGDLHLDSPYTSLSFGAADEARTDQRDVFEKMMRYVADNNIDLVLISGDLFDTKYITSYTRDLVIRELSALSCPVVISPGNHDPYTAVSLYNSDKLPSNVYVFSSEEMQKFDFDELGISVCGYAFMSDRLDHSPLCSFSAMAEAARAKKDNMLVLCAHADIASPISKYAPITVADIEKCSFAYAALGHIHNAPEIRSDKTLIKYCGFPMGRSFDELGDGGAYIVSIDNENVRAERKSFSSHRFLIDTLDVSSAANIYDIEKMISEHIESKKYGEETSLRLVLRGALPLDCVVNESKLSALKAPLRMLEIADKTTPMPDTSQLSLDPTLRGELYRTLLPSLNSDDPDTRRSAAEALRIGLCAISGGKISELLELDDAHSAGGAI